MNDILGDVAKIIWGPWCLMPLLVGTGIYLTFRFRFIQLRGLKHAFGILSGRYDDAGDPGEISHFRALATALSATIGTGNIVGVAAAILLGGPGAVFWMWVTAVFGMATKYTSCLLAVRYRRIDPEGEVHGGPMHFIEQGMGPRFRWLAFSFASMTAVASFGIGNMFQINNIVSSVNLIVFGADEGGRVVLNFCMGLAVSILVALVILGGIRRIAAFTSKLVPFMCAFYVFAGLWILLANAHLIPGGIALIFRHAFHAPEALAGGLFGAVIRQGVARGLFSNEAGLGSAAIAHGAARTREPVREGLVAMLGPLFDTLVVCTITALVIVCTGAYTEVSTEGQLTAAAFERGLPGSGWIVAVATVLFAFSTIISWSYYGDRAADYLFGKRMVRPYRWVYVGCVLLGACLKINPIINFCDIMNGLMALPNLVALLVLSPAVAALTREYFEKSVDKPDRGGR
jgi:AGCS family alanine or glycine:cation symporter